MGASITMSHTPTKAVMTYTSHIRVQRARITVLRAQAAGFSSLTFSLESRTCELGYLSNAWSVSTIE